MLPCALIQVMYNALSDRQDLVFPASSPQQVQPANLLNKVPPQISLLFAERLSVNSVDLPHSLGAF